MAAYVKVAIFAVFFSCFTESKLLNLRLGKQTKQYSPIKQSYDTLFFVQNVDHFSFANADTYKQRYLVNKDNWKPGGPIFFYTGNEGDITWFCNNTGFMWDIAPEFGAMLVFAEHRFYGLSMPYGHQSYSDPKHMATFTSEQALADFAVLLRHIKGGTAGAGDSAVVSFGGSYGGMLSAWFRMKYPNVVQGAIAASAPIWQFTGLTACGTFNEIVTDVFKLSGEGCAQTVRNSWAAVDRVATQPGGLSYLEQTFHLCGPLKDAETLKGWLAEAWGNVAMVNYPYKANFLEPLPPWPIKALCRYMNESGAPDKALLERVYRGVGVYFNSTGNQRCFNLSQQGSVSLGDLGWDFQACTEMVMPMCADGQHDMFEPAPWDFAAFSAGCERRWGVRPRQDWVATQYWGKTIQAASNIVFSNGLFDPWSGGGVLKSISDTLVAVAIHEAAHHEDLRSADPADLPQVVAARQVHKTNIRRWITEHAKQIAV